ncbi:DNA-3-methyladenine glycosylase [Dyadobacter sp. CY323]|uniref:DNA-3-methyladenine glycosylase family protein n=1 Tax=Dyadobacter sp. CY323 TaxID=2907302 RepID=UPI001F3AF9B9|nr:DNA glycosylase [Dyadobacter sp. CY323]MCE6992187.1 DNA repair protein [Dyadobacter sp. CY323]
MDTDRSILIPTPALFNFEECLWFLNRNYDDCLHEIEENSLIKALKIGVGLILIKVSVAGSFLEIEILSGEANAENKAFLVAYVTEWFDLERNIQPFYDLLKTDGRLAYMTEKYKGFRLIGIANLFEAICWCIIGQQINLAFAYKIKRRLVEQFGEKIDFDGKSHFIFPAPEVLAQTSVEVLRGMQFSDKKAQYVIGIANAFVDGSLSKEKLQALPDFAARKKALTSFKGIGAWTANYALMKTLKEPEGIPHGDVGLLNALSAHDIIRDRSETDKIDAFFNQYKGWESYLVFYLWRSLAVK